MSLSNERSAEWLRGEKAALRRLKPEVWGQGLKAYSTRDLRQLVDGDYFKAEKNIAAAEAREATQPTAAEVIEAAEKALGRALTTLSFFTTFDLSSPATECTAALAKIARWKEAK
jgi:hypothetical protein